MEFGWLIECYMRKIFHEKSCTQYDAETSHRSFLKKSKFNIYVHRQSEVSYSLFLVYVQIEDYRNILKLRS